MKANMNERCGGAVREWAGENRSRSLERGGGESVE